MGDPIWSVHMVCRHFSKDYSVANISLSSVIIFNMLANHVNGLQVSEEDKSVAQRVNIKCETSGCTRDR